MHEFHTQENRLPQVVLLNAHMHVRAHEHMHKQQQNPIGTELTGIQVAAFEGFKCSATILGFLLKLFSYHGVEKVARKYPLKDSLLSLFLGSVFLPRVDKHTHKTTLWFVLKTAAEILRSALYFEVMIIGTLPPTPSDACNLDFQNQFRITSGSLNFIHFLASLKTRK